MSHYKHVWTFLKIETDIRDISVYTTKVFGSWTCSAVVYFDKVGYKNQNVLKTQEQHFMYEDCVEVLFKFSHCSTG